MGFAFSTLTLLLVILFSLASWLTPWHLSWDRQSNRSGSLLATVLGDGRRLFARQFFVKADSYFHNGYYPTIYDNRDAFQTPHVAADTGSVEEKNEGDSESFLGPPKDWLDRFSRHFFPSRHSHLGENPGTAGEPGEEGAMAKGQERELLPWLKLSAELDPQRVETYAVAAFWLRTRLNKVDEAEAFLREGLKANPMNCELLFELGQLLYENRHDTTRARNLWELALQRWFQVEAPAQDPNIFLLAQVAGRLANLEEACGRYERAIGYLKQLKTYSPHPDKIQEWIARVKGEAAANQDSEEAQAKSSAPSTAP